MAVLAYPELCELIEDGVIDSDRKCVAGSSIAIRLGGTLFVEHGHGRPPAPQQRSMAEISLGGHNFTLLPGHTILASSREKVRMPDDLTAFLMAPPAIPTFGHLDVGLQSVEPCWGAETPHGSPLVMRLTNLSQRFPVTLKEDMVVGHLTFMGHSPIGFDKIANIFLETAT